MLRGYSLVNLDAKGRLAIPTRYRPDLQECCDCQLVVTKGLDGCLFLYPLPEWEKVERQLLTVPDLEPEVRNLKRFLIGNACECQMDAQGRILLADNLRRFAKLEKRVALAGQLNKFEIWNDTVWHEHEQSCLASTDGGKDAGVTLKNLSL